MKLLFFLIPAFFCLSCDKDEHQKFIVDTDIEFSVKDTMGNDLLNPINQNSFDTDQISILYLKNDEKVRYFDEDMNHPKGFFIYKHENEFRIRIFPNTNKNETNPVTFIKWSDADIDTVECIIKRTISSEICKKVWFNKELVWESYKNERFIEIIKEL